MILRLYHFLGSLSFTLCIFTFIIISVFAGTLLESQTQSHAYAENFVYGHPLFFIIFISLFANILFSATRRWPFKKKHIPFLITHLGLLLLLSGVWVKGHYGLQGHMHLLEGSGSHHVILPNRQMIQLQDRLGKTHEWHIQDSFFKGKHLVKKTASLIPLDLKLLDIHPHGEKQLALWKQKNAFSPYNMPPIAHGETALHPIGQTPWLFSMQELESTPSKDLLESLYARDAELAIYGAHTQNPLYIGPLKEAMNTPCVFSKGSLALRLQQDENRNWHLAHTWRNPEGRVLHEEQLSLSGEQALQRLNVGLWPDAPYSIQIKRTPSVTLLSCGDQENLLILGPFGDLEYIPFSQSTLKSVYAAEGGFGGYFIEALLPSSEGAASRQMRRLAHLERAMEHLSEQALEGAQHLFFNACKALNVDFAREWITFLDTWQQSGKWLYDLKNSSPIQTRLFEQLDLKTLPPTLLRAMQWSLLVLQPLQKAYAEGQDPYIYLKDMKWPLAIQDTHAEKLFETLQQQLFNAAYAFPKTAEEQVDNEAFDPNTQAALFSILMRQTKAPFKALWDLPEEESARTPLYCKIDTATKLLPPLSKLEDLTPIICLQAILKTQEETFDLVYDPNKKELALPILNGSYLAKCVPDTQEIPHHVRLRDARKISYPGSDQAASYEAQCLITDRRSGQQHEVLLSMNQVHETPDGHRFYLSGISPSHEESARQVRLVVNYDPTRNKLTYFGALSVALGILLLLFRRSNASSTTL